MEQYPCIDETASKKKAPSHTTPPQGPIQIELQTDPCLTHALEDGGELVQAKRMEDILDSHSLQDLEFSSAKRGISIFEKKLNTDLDMCKPSVQKGTHALQVRLGGLF